MAKKTREPIKEYKLIIAQQERQIYNLTQLLEISKSFSSTLESSVLIEVLLYSCMGQMQVTGAGIFSLQQENSSKYTLGKNSVGFELLPNINYFFQDDQGILPLLRQVEQAIHVKELQKDLTNSYDLVILESLEASLVVPMMYQKRIVGVLVLGKGIFERKEKIFTHEEKQLITDIATLLALSINTTLLIEQSSTDMLTKLKLRHFFYTVVDSKLRLAQETSIPIAIVMLDIDHFKRFNDIYGHTCGDFVLQRIAYLLKTHIRSDDIAARYGGEEFIVMLHNVDEAIAGKITERIRNTVENDDIVFSDIHMQVTLSAGYTIYEPKQMKDKKIKLEHLVNLADEAMYTSKRDGRNRVTYLPLVC